MRRSVRRTVLLTAVNTILLLVLTDQPAVMRVVLTGPTQTVAAAVAEHAPDETNLLELDFDRGAPAACG